MNRRRTAIGVVVALVLVVALLTDRWFVHPRLDDPGRADAIVVLGGGGDRVDHGVTLAHAGVADALVFASPFVAEEGEHGLWAARPCNTRPLELRAEVQVSCEEPEPGTTRGEAQMLQRLADEKGWESVVLVVSTDQVTRARRLVERCWDGDVRITAVTHDDPWPFRAIYEWGAGLKATVLRGC